jgi:type IV pilus assembly protein PilV
MSGTRSARRRNRGFTLIELLIAVVVLSVGLLGVAKLSLSTVQANGSSYMRSQATELVQQIIDDMHANYNVAVASGYNIAFGAGAPAGPDCDLVVCNNNQVANFDLARWVAALGTQLPNGQGQIVTVPSVNPTTGSNETAVIVTVQWNDSVAQWAFGTSTAVAPAPMQMTMETLL